MYRQTLLVLFSVLIFSCQNIYGQENSGTLKLISVQKIWDKAPHNAFTDLIRFQNHWFCVFREAGTHTTNDGSIRVITSDDGIKWVSAALISSTNSDLRDAKITITPGGQLMLSGAEALHDKTVHTHKSLVWFSDDGKSWNEKHIIGDTDFWLWRTTWHDEKAYNFGYACGDKKSLRLYESTDGKIFNVLVDDLNIEGYPNETSIVFKGDTAFCLLRRDGEKNTGQIGISFPPYSVWKWKDLGVRIGGPDIILLPDGNLLAAVRLYENNDWHPAYTALCYINPYSGKISEALKLPSCGDTSYAGIAIYNDILWVSYYSSHEGKTVIYLAKVAF